ncbi:MAG TPA: rhodanese-like domain-containing protein [Candidatus Kapabacteria bacterium]|jgi:rhodanese-related sulfurtransferase|nr:rhodanese-like domain-containing protein [Candidatus Kapabacteria bacterium]
MQNAAEGTTVDRPYDTITLDELRSQLAAGSIQEFWNVLTDTYFSGEYIPGSRRVPLDQIGRSVAALSRDVTIVVYCSSFDCPQSHAAAEKLAALGFTNVAVYAGGLKEWEDAGYELVATGTAVIP